MPHDKEPRCNHVHSSGLACRFGLGHVARALARGYEGPHYHGCGQTLWTSEETARLACICHDDPEVDPDTCPVHMVPGALDMVCDVCCLRYPERELDKVIARGWEGFTLHPDGWVTTGGQEDYLCPACGAKYIQAVRLRAGRENIFF